MTEALFDPVCLVCGINPVRREDVAGLCTSCRLDVEYGQLLVDSDRSGNVELRWSSVSFIVRFGDPDTVYAPIPYDPAAILPPDHTEAERGEVLAELLKLTFWRPLLTLRAESVYLIEAIRRCGVSLTLDTQRGRAVISDPRRVPYPLLVRFHELAEPVEDELTREREVVIAERFRTNQPDAEPEPEIVEGATHGGPTHERLVPTL